MTISETFEKQPWASRLGRRKDNFLTMLKHVQDFAGDGRRALIVETGTAWDKDNYEGQGQSTLIWDWGLQFFPNVQVVSCDLNPAAMDYCKTKLTHQEKFHFMVGNSVLSLRELGDLEQTDDIALLYLDSYDWSEAMNLESSFHHMMELCTVFAKLPSGCMVAIDDRHGDMRGKHWLVEVFMKNLKISPVFKGHQIGWVIP